MAVNKSAWQSWSIAPRDTVFSADDAIARLQARANGSAKAFNEGFLYRIDGADPKNPDSYRLPLADVVNGKLTLIPRAVFSAGVIMSGGHGGLYDVLSDSDRNEIRSVLTRIYDTLGKEYSDPRVVAPWLRGRTQEERDEEREEMNASWQLPVAPDDHSWNAQHAKRRVWEWAQDIEQYSTAFLWSDGRARYTKNARRLPVADVIDGRLVLIPRAVDAVVAALLNAPETVDIPAADRGAVLATAMNIQHYIAQGGIVKPEEYLDDELEVSAALSENSAGYGIVACDDEEGEDLEGLQDLVTPDSDDEIEASVAPVRPPAPWFRDPEFTFAAPLTVTADGRVSGYAALFNKCHMGIGDRCVMAPKSKTDYRYFKNGSVLLADGSQIKVGKITMSTGHAGTGLRAAPAIEHYDNTGTVIAVVNVGEDHRGIWMAGAVVPSATEEQIQELRRSPVSGDWRRIPEVGNLELVAALAVNSPGFPIIASLDGPDGEVDCIVAAGVVLPDGSVANEVSEESEVDRKLRERVDELDTKITEMLAGRRARTYDRITSAMDGRK